MPPSAFENESSESTGPEIGQELTDALRRALKTRQGEAEKSATEGHGRGGSSSVPLLHISCIAKARGEIPNSEMISELAALFKVLADPTRIRLLSALSASELCVCDLCALLGMSLSAMSHQLALLRGARVVSTTRKGKVVWYALDNDHVAALLAMGLEHLGEARRGEAGRQV